jgi:flavin reductase (DIM6/NTAB) family NADH-FMN oxidoreductase RutF
VIDNSEFRSIMAEYPTGVTIVTSCREDGEPVGMSVNSFTSLSLSPPLVLMCVGLESATWPVIRDSGAFAVNVLAAGHGDVCRRFSRKGVDRFEGLLLRRGTNGAPLLTEISSVAIECSIDQEVPGGDHLIITGAVTSLHRFGERDPLLFFRGGFSGEKGEER